MTSFEILTCNEFQRKNYCGKKKKRKIWLLSGKKCYFVSINSKLIQFTDNDRLSRRIRGYFGRQGAVPPPGGVQKTIAGRGNDKVRYQQGF